MPPPGSTPSPSSSLRKLAAAAEVLRAPGETVLAVARTDLDEERTYRERFIVLTTQRVMALDRDRAEPLVEVPLEMVSGMEASDRGGAGTLIVLGEHARLAAFDYTVARAEEAKALVDRFTALRAGLDVGPVDENAMVELAEDERPADLGALLRLLSLARRRMGAVLLGSFLTLAATAVGLIPPYLTWPLVDDIFQPYQAKIDQVLGSAHVINGTHQAALEALKVQSEPAFAAVPMYLLGMAGAALLAWALAWAQGWTLAWVSERMSADLRNATYSHLQRLSLDFFTSRRTGDLVARISSDTDRLCNFLSDTLADFITDCLMIVGTAAILFWMSPLLGFAALCTFPLVAWLTYRLRSKLRTNFLHGGRAWGEMTSILADTVPGIRVVKAFAQEGRESRRFAEANDRIVAANDRTNRVWTFFWPLVALLNQFGLLVVWAVGAYLIFNQRLTVGMLTASLAYIGRFYVRLESMSRMAGLTQRAAASAQRLFEILDRAPGVPEPAHPIEPGRLRGAIEFRNVGFRFGNRRVLDRVNLSIAPGEMIGVVGETGAGKSTLVNLLCRFYDPSEGSIVVDGVDLRTFSLESYRKNVGIVLQDPFLFYGTLAENIAYGRPEATRFDIVQSARAARAHDFILKLPEAYDSIVGERGQTLSGGERQRVSIARALLIDPRILVLDEATSAVDPDTEQKIQEALDELVRGRTTIAIAHRLSTLRRADRIVVVEQGSIVEIGTHDELLAREGAYARLHRAQARDARAES